MAEVILSIVLENLRSLIQNEIGLLWGNEEMKKLESTFSTILAVLEDAEQKQHLQENKPIKDWLRKLKYATYEIDDILDDCATEANRLESGFGKEVRLSSLTSYPIVGNIWFRHKFGNRMREIRDRLDQIAEERMKLHLREMVVEKRVGFSDPRLTGAFLTEPKVYGRDAEKEKIVQVLINHVNDDHEDLLVYPIIGMGGLGKTTLAQFVYNDERVTTHFEAKIWVCVSEDFDVKRILKEIIKSATQSSACEDLELDPLQRLLQGKLNGKRYLLVLDDVWNEDQGKWETLKCILKQCGAKGTSIITTTRLQTVASIMRTHPSHSHMLTELSNDDCWLLFKQGAFESEREEYPELVKIGKEIVKKCAGVPLAAKALGSLMRSKKEERQWVDVKDSEIWNLPQDDEENSILPALRLSYQNLALPLRRCFAYCSVFEKDTEIEKDDLIHLWMANGFISSANGSKEMEDIGNDIWNELHFRSLFRDVDDELEGIVTFKMHDFMHELAHSVMDEDCQIMEVESPNYNFSNNAIRYLNLIASSEPLTTMPKELKNFDSLRTLLYTEKQGIHQGYSLEFSIFKKHGALRAFAARASSTRSIGITRLASSIGSLKHLRYLRLCGEEIITLPDSICSLFNLQTLNLDGCDNLERLPENMRCLRNLKHLIIKRCAMLIEIPPFIGELTCLKVLSRFIVAGRRGCGLDELKCLDLGKSLIIKNLGMVKNWTDAQKANLMTKKNLHSLELSWGIFFHTQENADKLLEALQPPSNLKKLVIHSFEGTHFPPWMDDYLHLSNIVEMGLLGCRNCRQLPPLHQLPSLRILYIRFMDHVEYILNHNKKDDVQCGSDTFIGFPCLEKLAINDFPNLKGLSEEEDEERRGTIFPRLRILGFRNCPKLTTLPCYLSALEEFSIYDYPELTSLSELLKSLTSLRSLRIEDCPQLTSITNNFPRELPKLKSLVIRECPKLARRYEKERGEDWQQIAHIPSVIVSQRIAEAARNSCPNCKRIILPNNSSL